MGGGVIIHQIHDFQVTICFKPNRVFSALTVVPLYHIWICQINRSLHLCPDKCHYILQVLHNKDRGISKQEQVSLNNINIKIPELKKITILWEVWFLKSLQTESVQLGGAGEKAVTKHHFRFKSSKLTAHFL